MALIKHFVTGAALASVALAAPQKPDYAAINAAPTVANGPSLIADSGDVQTASLATSFTLDGAATAAATGAKRAVEPRDFISSMTSDASFNGRFGVSGQLTTVAQAGSCWISGGSTHNFYGNINNNGRIVVSQTSYLQQNPSAGGQTCGWTGHDANNGNLVNSAGALIQLNDFGSVSAPTYDWYLHSMVNNGTIQWCGRGDTGGSTFQLYSDLDAYNYGLISFEQFNSNIGASFVWRNPTLTTSNTVSNIYNHGTFRLVNVVYHNVQNVYGTGCWQIGAGAVLYLEDGSGLYQNPTGGPTFPGQSITFQDSSAVLHMDTAVYSRNSNFGAQIFGFGAGNAIEFYQSIQTYSYSGSSGLLNVKFVGGYQVNIKLGLGYDSSKFVQKRNSQKYNVFGYNAIFYNGACPSQNVPSKCSTSTAICSNPSSGLPSYGGSSSSSSTRSAGGSTSSAAATASTSTSSKASGSPSTTSNVPSFTTTTKAGTVSAPITSTASSSVPTSTSPATTSAAISSHVPKTCPGNPNYTPYYPAISTGYTTDPALSATSTTTAGQPCVTQPEAGTYCGFINPEDPCAAQPDGYGPVPTPDTASAFLEYQPYHSMASAAPTVIPSTADSTEQYTQVFKDLNASVAAQSYLGQYTLQTYNASECASKCDCTELCQSFNLFVERDPSLNPSANDSTAPTVWGYWCPNPPAMASFKCTLWGSAINSSDATNTGQWREQFQVVVAGSDGWTLTGASVPSSSAAALPSSSSSSSSVGSSSVASSLPSSSAPKPSSAAPSSTKATSPSSSSSSSSSASSSATATAPSQPSSYTPPTPPSYPGYGAPKSCGGKGMNAPSYSLGTHFFPGPFNPFACGSFADAQTQINVRAGVSQGVLTFNAYYLHKNGKPHGTFCSLYSSVLDPLKWATYAGEVFGGDEYTCQQSWAYSKVQ